MTQSYFKFADRLNVVFDETIIPDWSRGLPYATTAIYHTSITLFSLRLDEAARWIDKINAVPNIHQGAR